MTKKLKQELELVTRSNATSCLSNFLCWAWKEGGIHKVKVQGVNGYEAQKAAARKLKVRMIKVGVKPL